jgi:hypothetical protein
MSHIVTIKTQLRDPDALAAACRRLGLSEPVRGKVTLFATEAEGLIVQLPGWTYPAVIDPHGQVHYDNYNGAWGEQKQLDRLLQAYAVEKALLEARRAGRSVYEQPLPDGSVKLTVSMGGAA